MSAAKPSETTDGTRPLSLWDIYKFSYLLALRSLSFRHSRTIARLLLEPCTYWRNVEVPAVLNHLKVRPGERVLDIGSPKLPSLFVWSQMQAEIYATDLFPYFVEEYSYLSRRLSNHGIERGYRIEIQDGRSLGYPDCHFDKVYAISVIEHIEDDGDSQAMREIARVLKVGGLCCLTVPFAPRYREDTIDYQIYFKDSAPGKPVFWQRRYDLEALEARLIVPSCLSVSTIEYFGERWFSFEQFYERLPQLLRIIFSVPGPAFSKLFLYKLDEGASSAAKTALLVLRKTAAGSEVKTKG